MEKEIKQSEKEALMEVGFQGWVTVNELRSSCACVPANKGVYMVLRYLSDEMPEFLEKGSGGLHKGTDMNYKVSDLESHWVNDTSIMYIGKTDNSLRKRISTYIKHGMGQDAAHRGGRSVWQLPDAADLVFIWFPIKETADARTLEIMFLNEFRESHNGRLPFANRTK